MKKFMAVAAIVAIAACGGEKKAEMPAADTAAMAAPAAPAPATDSAAAAAPATVDSAAKAAVDSAKH